MGGLAGKDTTDHFRDAQATRQGVRADATLTRHPEQPTQEADDQQLPHLFQALLGRRQQAAVRELLEELLAAVRSHH